MYTLSDKNKDEKLIIFYSTFEIFVLVRNCAICFANLKFQISLSLTSLSPVIGF